MDAMNLHEVKRLHSDLEKFLGKESSWTAKLHNNGVLDVGFSNLNYDIMHQCNLWEFPKKMCQNEGAFEGAECKTAYSDDPEWYPKLIFQLDLNTNRGLDALRRIVWFLDRKYYPMRDERYDFYC